MLLPALLLLFADLTAPDAIRIVLDNQQSAWNRGNIEGFMQGYNNSPETTFIGKSLTKGYAGVLANYRKRYPTAEAMGKLNFTEIEVKPLDEKHAYVTGQFHLTRTQAAGGEAVGIFSLFFERENTGWKIILDHTS